MKNGDKKFFYWDRLISLLTVILMLTAVALQKNGTVIGITPEEILTPANAEESSESDTLQVLSDGTLLVNTMPLASEVYGYAGATPLRIYVKDGIIDKIEAADNAETPDFFSSATEKIFPQYLGKSISEALAMQVDAATGATYSSIAIKENLHRGLTFVQPHVSSQPVLTATTDTKTNPFDTKTIVAIIVVLSGVILPHWLKGKGFRWIQLALNVVVLGCWCGTFISYSLLVGFLSNGINLGISIIALLLLLVAFVFPLFGKNRHYCMWICPLGAAQEIIFRLIPRKAALSQSFQRLLLSFRWIVWSVLMLLMWTGVWFEWMNYELFSIFLFQQASWIVIVLSIIFALLSSVVSRPYCRFLCPTGCLLQTIENKKLEAQM